MNFWYQRIEWNYILNLPGSNEIINGQTHDIDQPVSDLSYEIILATNIANLIDHLDLLLTYGTLSTEMRGIIETAVTDYATTGNTPSSRDIVQFAIYLFMISPEYAIQV
jgi:hypothetical protein